MPSSDGTPGGSRILLQATGIRRSFGPVPVLRGIDLVLGPGEALAIAGPNGAGKTTLLRLLAGLMRPSAGEVRVLGQLLPPGDSPMRRAIGLLSHQSLLYDDLTLLENLTFAARLYRLPRPSTLAAAALAEVGLAERAGDSPRRLSRGLVQRAAIARSLLHRPRLLLLDEPFTGLDAAAAEWLRSRLLAGLAEGMGVVLVTHHLGEAWEVATRVAVLVEGRWAVDEPRGPRLDDFLPRYAGLLGA